MKKNLEKSVNFRNEVINGKSEVKKAVNDIFFLRAQLRTLARKNDFCDSKSVATVAKAVRNYTNGGCMFDLSVFVQIRGDWFYRVEKTTVTKYGKETYITTAKVSLSVFGLFNAFCKVAANEIKKIEAEEYKALCEEEKAHKKHVRNVNNKLKELSRALDKGIITPEEYNAKVALLG